MVGIINLYENRSAPTLGAIKGARICLLTDVISCIVTEELNKTFYLEMEYYGQGNGASELTLGRIIGCKSTPFDEYEQLFRICQIKKTTKQNIKILANHISYDLSKYIVRPLGFDTTIDPETHKPVYVVPTGNMSYVIDWLVGEYASIYGYPTDIEVDPPVQTFPFSFSLDPVSDSIWAKNVSLKFTDVLSVREWIGKSDIGILSIFGCDIKFGGDANGCRITFCKHRGKENADTRIIYGKNLKDYNDDLDGEKITTGFLPCYRMNSNVDTGTTVPFGFEESEYAPGEYDIHYEPFNNPDYTTPIQGENEHPIIKPEWGFSFGDSEITVPFVVSDTSGSQTPLDYSKVSVLDTTSEVDSLISSHHDVDGWAPTKFSDIVSYGDETTRPVNPNNPTPQEQQMMYMREIKRQWRNRFIGEVVDKYIDKGSFLYGDRSIEIDYLSIGKSDNIQLGDNVEIYGKTGYLMATKRATKIEYDAVRDRYNSVTFDETEDKYDLSSVIANTAIEKNQIKSDSEAKSASFESDVKKIIDSYGTGAISGSGTENNIVKWTGTSSVGNSGITIDAENRVTFPGTITANPNPGQNSSISNYILGTRMIKQDITSNNVSNKYVTMLPYNVDHSYIGNQSYPWERGYFTNIISGLSTTSFDGANDSIGCWDSSGYLKKRTFASLKNEIIPATDSSTRNKVLKHVYDDSDQPVIDEVAWADIDVGWNDITGKPGTFPPSSHTHSASDITSGTLAPARIPIGTGLNNQNNAINVIEPVPVREGSTTGNKILYHHYYEDPDDPDSSIDRLEWANLSTVINTLGLGTSDASATNYIIAQDSNGAGTYYRRPLNKIIKGVLGYSQSGTNFPVQMSSGNKLYVSVPSATANPIKVGSRVVTSGNTVVLAEGNGMNIQLQESGSTSTITFTVTSVPCVIEGTPIRLANGVDIPVEELQNGDEILSWDPNTEQFTTAIVCVVRNTGKDKEFVDHIFDDGSHLTTFGEHVVYNKTKGYPMDISKFEPGDETINVNGETIVYCGSLRHYCRERRMAHYDISSSNNLYFAGGILNGKMQFAKFRAMDDLHMELTPAVQAVFDIHKAENAKDLGYENNDEYYKQIAAEFKQQMSLKKKIADAKQKLADSDYLVQKFTENLLTLTEWAKAKTNRANWRTIINDSEALLKPVEERINAIKSKFATRRNNKRTRFNQQCQIDNEHFADYKAMFKKGETDEK